MGEIKKRRRQGWIEREREREREIKFNLKWITYADHYFLGINQPNKEILNQFLLFLRKLP